MQWLGERVVANARAIVIVVAALTVGAIYKTTQIRIAFSTRELFAYKGNQDLLVLNRYLEEFGDDGGFVAAVIEHPNIFSSSVLRYVKDLSRELEMKPVFRQVRSLSTTVIPRGQGDLVHTGPLFDRVPDDPRELADLRRVAIKSRLLVPRLLSADGRYTVVAAEMRTPSCVASIEEQDEAATIVRATVARLKAPAGAVVLVGGPPVIESEIRRVLIRDQLVFAAAGLVLMVVVLWVAFGNLHGVLLPLSSTLVYLGWTGGLMVLLGEPINLISNTLPIILLTYGLLDTLFLLSAFYDSCDEGRPRQEAARLALSRMGWPCLLCSVTTAVGFASYVFATVPLFRSFGLCAAAGVLFALFANLIWLPALLSLVPQPRAKYRRRPATRAVERLAAVVWRVVQRRPRTIAVALVIAVAGCIGIFAKWSRVDIYYLKELPSNTEGMKVNRLISEKLSGVTRTAVTITGRPGSMSEPATLRALDELNQWAKRQTALVRSSLSLADVVAAMHQAFNGGKAEYASIPSSRALINQYLSLLDPDTRSSFVRDDFSRTHIRILATDVGSRDWEKFYVQLEAEAHRLLGSFTVELTGIAKTTYRAQELTVREMIVGFILAFVIIDLLLVLAFRSIRVGLIAILPNLFPTVACMALLAGTGISLRVGTALFLSVSVGLVFDNTIQLLAATKRAVAAGASMDDSIQRAYHAVAPPLIFAAALIACGFGIFALSQMEILRAFGMLCVGAVLIGAVSDVFGTMALLHWAGRTMFRGPGPARGDR
jgi:uncharacterized protein